MPEENEKPEVVMPSKKYAIISVVRARHNRTARAALPQKPRRKQHIGPSQVRMAHGRPLIMTEEQVLSHLDELKAKSKAHILEVRTLDGRVVDLETMQPREGAPTAKTTPSFPLDSVNNDKNFPGMQVTPPYMSDDLSVPQVLAPGAKPDLFKQAEETAAAAEENDGDRPTPLVDATDIDALVEAAQASSDTFEAAPEVTEEVGTAPTAKEEVSSEKKSSGSSGRGSRRNR